MSNAGKDSRSKKIADALFGTEESAPKVYYLLVSALFAVFLIQPLANDFWWGLLMIRTVYVVILVGSVWAMTRRPWPTLFAFLLPLPALAVRDLMPGATSTTIVVFEAALVAVFAFAIVSLLRVLLKHPVVTFATVAGATSVYLLIGVMWSLIYIVVEHILPCSFSGVACAGDLPAGAFNSDASGSLFYFSFVTISTLGYGEITPVGEVARMFATMEAVVGQLYLVILLAGLVSLASSVRVGGSGRSKGEGET